MGLNPGAKTEPEAPLKILIRGPALLDTPIFNKGTAFPEDERRELGLLGLLPFHSSSVEEQLARTYENYQAKESDIERYVFLTALQDRNETLFYQLVFEHITEMMPIIYTPTVGLGCQRYSHVFRRPRGLYISYPYRNEIATLLDNAPPENVEVIVVTDGERILGLGDLGVGGMGIPVGKLSLYTLCAGIHPQTTLPILLDVGTDNPELLNDPLYLGWRHERIRGEQYDAFIEAFISSVEKNFPNVLLQWEDFSKNNASRLLERYRDRLCTFNDDIQGTGAVTLAGLLAAVKVTRSQLREQRVAILGAGSSAIGISDQIVAAMMRQGLSEAEALLRIWLVDSRGLVHSARSNLEPAKQQYAQPVEMLKDWILEGPGQSPLKDVVTNARPTILIGTSAQPGAFGEEIINTMAQYTERPMIFPLSNPTSKSEATPADILRWTDGRALVATGSPFSPVTYKGKTFNIGQCNNAFIFPGVGLGVLAAQAKRVNSEMFVAAALTLSDLSPTLKDLYAPLYPPLEQVREASRKVALAVAQEAQRSGLAMQTTMDELERRIDAKIWPSKYRRLIP
ncbi:MAG TPA: NAD-dependent malic enzyme [Pyrinomonadaceae bacterium]|nr:NAD-dependent malic enzyme [Pyrinomonadaceae bacterium]